MLWEKYKFVALIVLIGVVLPLSAISFSLSRILPMHPPYRLIPALRASLFASASLSHPLLIICSR